MPKTNSHPGQTPYGSKPTRTNLAANTFCILHPGRQEDSDAQEENSDAEEEHADTEEEQADTEEEHADTEEEHTEAEQEDLAQPNNLQQMAAWLQNQRARTARACQEQENAIHAYIPPPPPTPPPPPRQAKVAALQGIRETGTRKKTPKIPQLEGAEPTSEPTPEPTPQFISNSGGSLSQP